MIKRYAIRACIALAVAAAVLTPPAPRAHGDAQTYAASKRPLRVGIITSSALDVPGVNGSGPENTAPYLFYVAERRTDLKPYGMEFVNPLAPSTITPSLYQRWLNRLGPGDPTFQPGTAPNQIFQVGAKVTKNMGAYWEVNLDGLSATDLQQYDLLYLRSHKNQVSFPADQREMLRKFVDGGGTLWIENAGGFSFNDNSPFLLDVNMNSGGGAGNLFVGAANHPLLTQPFQLTPQEVSRLGDHDPGSFYLFAPNPAAKNAGGPGPNVLNPPGGGALTPVLWNTRGNAPFNAVMPAVTWRPYVLAGSLGAGLLVFGSGDSGSGVANYAGPNGNNYAVAGETHVAAQPEDLKFLYNLANWTGAHRTAYGTVRRNAESQEKLGSTLTAKWSKPPTSNPVTTSPGGMAFARGCIFVVDSSMWLHCIDATPGRDADGDGNSDDGFVDWMAGYSFDVIWSRNLAGDVPAARAASTPTVIEYYDNDLGGAPSVQGLLTQFQRDQVVVVVDTQAGPVIRSYRAFPRISAAPFSLSDKTAPDWEVKDTAVITPYSYGLAYTSLSVEQVPAVAYSEGVVFATVNTAQGGRILAINPDNGSSAFLTGTPSLTHAVPRQQGASRPFIGTPTVGYVTDRVTGASDKMIYVHAQRIPNVQQFTEALVAIPFGTRGEPLTRDPLVQPDDVPTIFRSRASGVSAGNNTNVVPTWYIVDPNNPGLRNTNLRQRVYATYVDPATGARYSRELTYDQSGGQPDSYKIEEPLPVTSGRHTRVVVVPQVTFPGLPGSVRSNSDNLTISADYTLDWTAGPTNPPNPLNQIGVTQRSTLNVIESASQPTNNVIGGSPALSGDDTVYWTMTAGGQTIGATSGLMAQVEQGANRSALRWSFTFYDDLIIPPFPDQGGGVNGAALPVPGRLRQLDRGTAVVTGVPSGASISQVQLIGTPVTRGNVVYVAGRAKLGARNISILAAFNATPQLRLQLPPNLDPATLQNIEIRQFNPFNTTVGPGAFVVLDKALYTIDPASGVVTIDPSARRTAPGGAAQATGNVPYFSTSLPFSIRIPGAQEYRAFGIQVDSYINASNQLVTEQRPIGPAGMDNLLWYAVIPADTSFDSPFKNPGLVSSSPTLQGDTLWLGFERGVIMSFDADPAATDPTAQKQGAQIALVDETGTAPKHLRWATLASSGVGVMPIWNAPVGANGVMVVNTATGVRAYQDTRTIIADAKRLIEVNGAGEPVWSSDGSRSYGLAGGPAPQFTINPATGQVIPPDPTVATGVAVVQRVPWARPQVVRRVSSNELLVVDTGNNRVVQIDMGANVQWEVNRVQDDMRELLRPGDPVTLNEPTDCLYWTEFAPNLNQWFAQNGLPYTHSTTPGFIVHYLIADTGNFRIIELVDVYDAFGRLATVNKTVNAQTFPVTLQRQLFFASSTYSQFGRKYRYRSVQRIVMQNRHLPPSWKDPNKTDLMLVRLTLAIIQNYRAVGNPGVAQSAVNALGDTVESGGGSLVVLGENGSPLSVVSKLRIPDPTKPGGVAIQSIVDPRWFEKFDDGVDPMSGLPIFKYVLADANGVYQLRVGSTPDLMDVEWLMSARDYYNMTGKRLNATSIRRLGTAVVPTPGSSAAGLHHFLIVNRTTGQDNPSVFGITYNANVNDPSQGNILGPSEFHGEVFELAPSNFRHGADGNRGYVRDYGPGLFNSLRVNPAASIVWRAPTERIPAPYSPGPPASGSVGFIQRIMGDPERGTRAPILEQPAFADRGY